MYHDGNASRLHGIGKKAPVFLMAHIPRGYIGSLSQKTHEKINTSRSIYRSLSLANTGEDDRPLCIVCEPSSCKKEGLIEAQTSTYKLTAQFITLCSGCNLAEARRIPSLWQGSSPAKTRGSSMPSRPHRPHHRPSTNCDKLSDQSGIVKLMKNPLRRLPFEEN